MESKDQLLARIECLEKGFLEWDQLPYQSNEVAFIRKQIEGIKAQVNWAKEHLTSDPKNAAVRIRNAEHLMGIWKEHYLSGERYSDG